MLMPIDNQTSIKNKVNLLINLITNRYYLAVCFADDEILKSHKPF
jgi:hypothetical protein